MSSREGSLAAAAWAMLLWCAPPASAHPAWGIVVDEDGVVFFTDVTTNSVWRRAPDGQLSRLARGLHSHPLWFDRESGLLYGEHVWWNETEQSWGRYFWSLTRAGSVERVAAVPEHLQWVTDRHGGARYRPEGARVLRVDPDGGSDVVGGDPFAGLERPSGSVNSIALAPDGSLYVADSGYRRVWKLRPEAELERVRQTGWLWAPMGVTLTEEAMYVLEDRPNGPAMILSFWAGPRVIRVGSGGPEPLVVVAGEGRAALIAVAGLALLVIVAGIVGFRRWRRSRLIDPSRP